MNELFCLNIVNINATNVNTISTILFHAWSEIEHDIIYKPFGDEKLLKTLLRRAQAKF